MAKTKGRVTIPTDENYVEGTKKMLTLGSWRGQRLRRYSSAQKRSWDSWKGVQHLFPPIHPPRKLREHRLRWWERIGKFLDDFFDSSQLYRLARRGICRFMKLQGVGSQTILQALKGFERWTRARPEAVEFRDLDSYGGLRACVFALFEAWGDSKLGTVRTVW